MTDTVSLIRTNSTHPDFTGLVRRLDEYLAVVDGNEHAFYAQYNTLVPQTQAVILYAEGQPAACGAIKELEPGVIEIKRMFTEPSFRGRGFAKRILQELEKWALEIGYRACRLETGRRLADAVGLYQQSGYTVIPNYGQYEGVDNSVCFEKVLDHQQ